MEKHIVWKQEKGNIGKVQWIVRSVLVCLAYIVFGKGVMGLLGYLFGFQEVLQHGGIYFLATLGVALWNERPVEIRQRKSLLSGNILLLGILLIVIWFAYREDGQILKEGFLGLINVYMDRWSAHTSKYIFTDIGSVSAMLTAVEFLLLIVVPILEMVGCKFRKKRLSLILPVALSCMGLLVVCSPQWEEIVFLFFSGVLFFYLDGYDRINGKSLCIIVVGVLLLLGITDGFQEKAEKLVLSYNEEWFFLQENLEESIRNGKLFDRFSQEDKVDNSTPRYKDKEVIQLSVSQKPEGNIYLRGYHCEDYEEGIWTKDTQAFAEACADYGIEVEEAARRLSAIQYESEDVKGNEQITYELRYTGIRDTNLYFPYAAGWEEEPERYSFPGDFIVKKKKNRKSATALSWKELRYLDEAPIMGVISNEQGIMQISGTFESGYSVDNLSSDDKALVTGYNDFVQQNYLEIPEDIPAIKQMVKLINQSMGGDGSQELWENTNTSAEIINNRRLQVAQVVAYWLRTQNKYALELDKLPAGEDALEYFLSTSHKGYCVHFASAGTLILRELGVPARYVTGFVVKPGELIYEEDTYKASVLDSDAHAWVEIYMDSYGWIPVEMTPGYGEAGSGERVTVVVPPVPETTPEPDTEEPEVTPQPEEEPDEPETTPKETQQPEEEKQEDGKESNKDNGDGKGGNGLGTDAENGEKKSVGKFIVGSISVIMVCLVAIFLYQYHVGNTKRKARLLNAYMLRGENRKAVKWINQANYKALVEIDRKYAKLRDAEYLEALKQEFGEVEESRWEAYFDVVRKTVYSREEISAEEVKKCYALYRLVQQNSKKNTKNP